MLACPYLVSKLVRVSLVDGLGSEKECVNLFCHLHSQRTNEIKGVLAAAFFRLSLSQDVVRCIEGATGLTVDNGYTKNNVDLVPPTECTSAEVPKDAAPKPRQSWRCLPTLPHKKRCCLRWWHTMLCVGLRVNNLSVRLQKEGAQRSGARLAAAA